MRSDCEQCSSLTAQAEDQTQKQADLVKINEVAVHNLELEINMYKYAAVKQDKEIEKLEIERQKFGAEASKSATNFMKVCQPAMRHRANESIRIVAN